MAGVWPSEDVPVWELPLERWELTLRQNLTSVFLTARGFLREVERNGHGSLVLVGSTAGIVGEAGHADYAAAKSAVLGGLLLSLKNEIVRVAPAARVNAVAPGWTESAMTRGHVDPEAVRRISRTMALRKIARPEDVARQVVVLASDELSGHVTGQVVTVAGGMEGRVLHEQRLRNEKAAACAAASCSSMPQERLPSVPDQDEPFAVSATSTQTCTCERLCGREAAAFRVFARRIRFRGSDLAPRRRAPPPGALPGGSRGIMGTGLLPSVPRPPHRCARKMS